MADVSIIGGGLSGCEAALQAADHGLMVDLYEMRPITKTGAHQTEYLAELVCSNSLGSQLPTRPTGLLMQEMEKLNCRLLAIAKSCQVPAGHALAIDRLDFAKKVTKAICAHPNIKLIRHEMSSPPEGIVVIASGPLTSKPLADYIKTLTSMENLFFFDAVAPIIEYESINMDTAFWGSRYGRGNQENGDYINCPFDQKTYAAFIEELIHAERVQLKDFEQEINDGVHTGKSKYFEACLPIEVMAMRGEHTLAFGPLRPVGLTNPHRVDKPYAVVQLRQDDKSGETYNLVGFQTNLTYSEQKRIFRMIPGLEKAQFVRYGQMHRNTFIFSPGVLNEYFQLISNNRIHFCGQITGLEGYLSNIASGLFTGINLAKQIRWQSAILFPETTMIGALFSFATRADNENFQPMKPNFGLLPPLEEPVRSKEDRFEAYVLRAQADMDAFLNEHGKNI